MFEEIKIQTKNKQTTLVCLNELSLFGLDRVGWSHVVAGDVTFLAGVDGASLPPVAFPGGKRVSEMEESVKQLNLCTVSHLE